MAIPSPAQIVVTNRYYAPHRQALGYCLSRAIAAEIRALTPKPVRYVVNTHWHNDHVSGVGRAWQELAGRWEPESLPPQ